MLHRLKPVPVALGLCLISLSLLPACRSTDSSASKAVPPLRIGVMDDSPPLIFREKRRWKGVEAELGRALAARLDKKAVFSAFPPEQLTQALLDGKVDILMAGLAITEERRVQMDFSSPYLVVGQAALIRPTEAFRYSTKIKIRSTRNRVGVIHASRADDLVTRYFVNATRVPYANREKVVEALQNNEVALWVGDAPLIWWTAQHTSSPLGIAPVLFAKEELGWAFRRGSVTLREAANEALLDWQKDGTLEMVLGRWIPFSQ
jgi:polar amino acid transport system substrate-binding protein